MLDKIRNIINSGSQRSVSAKKNIIAMLFLKGGNIIIGLILVPLTLGYVNSETYGLWMTISSMVAWIHFFDIGLGNGLKNRLVESFAQNDVYLSKKYVSTTYAILTLIFIPVLLISLFVLPLLNWESILNVSSESIEGLNITICITMAYFCLNFIFSTINTILLADQRPADASFRTFAQQLLSLLIIFILTKTTEGSLVNLCIALCVAPLLVVFLFNFTLFKGRYRDISPSLKSVDFKVAPSLLKLGVQFFIIQIAGVIQNQMTNFLIMRHFGGAEVTAYNVSNKYFSVLMLVWSIFTTPLWAGFADAIAKKDYIWIESIQKKYLKLFGLFSGLGIVMLLISNFVYDIWVGDKVLISFSLSMWVLIYNVVTMFSGLYVSFINGSGKLKIQTIACLISPVVFLFVAYGLMKAGVGVIAILIASVVCNFNGIILAPLQTKYILKNFKKSI